MSFPRHVRPAELVAAAIDHVALEGSEGVAVSELMDAIDPSWDAQMRRKVWTLLRRQQVSGVLQLFYVVSPSLPATVTTAGKKRKRPTGSSAANSAKTASRGGATPTDTEETNANDALQTGDATLESTNGHTDTTASTEEGPTPTSKSKTSIPPSIKDPKRELIQDAEAIAYEDACPVGNLTQFPRRKRVFIVACEELRLRALNVSRKAILAEFGDDHLKILEAIGRTRTNGITIPALCDVFGKASTVKKIHNSLDTLLSYNLVVKRMMIVARPTMRRLNIVHLPRFAAQFVPEMFDSSAEFESDDTCKKILASAAEAYLKGMPTKSAVMYDLGRDLGFQRRHLEVLKNHIAQECKRDDAYHLELFQAVLHPPKKGSTAEPKILNCVRYRPPSTEASDVSANGRGMSLEVGLLSQIYGAIEENGENGTTIIDLRNQMVLPGNKLPYKLVSILAGTYGLRAEAIILGKNKAFRLYPMLAKGAHVRDTKSIGPGVEHDDEEVEDITVIPSSSDRTEVAVASPPVEPAEARGDELFSVRANLALKVALGGTEVEGTRQRRRDHIMSRLVNEKIISLSSMRASMFVMEKRYAVSEASQGAAAGADGAPAHIHVGMVDTRSVSRIAAELEEEGALRLLQLPLPPRNVSTKFRALRCVVLPGYEDDEAFIQEFVKNYGRDERLRRIHQNANKHEVVRLRSIDSEEEDVPGFTLIRRPRKRQRQLSNGAASNGDTEVEADNAVEQSASEVSYRVRRFASHDKTSVRFHQYRRLGFAYGVMYRCKQLHQFLWKFLHEHPEIHLRDEEIDVAVRHQEQGEKEGTTTPTLDGSRPNGQRGVVFSRETVLRRLPVYLYILAFSGGSVLTPAEFALVEDAVNSKADFDVLPPNVCAKIWAHESSRSAKVLGTLSDLKLVVPHKIGMGNLIKILRAGYTDDRDSILAQALKDNALGGLFRLRNHIRIALDDRQTEDDTSRHEDRGFNSQTTIKLVGTTERSFSFGTLLPLRHSFYSSEDVDRYWEAFEGLCIERMIMEVPKPKANEPLVCEVPLPVKSRARRMFRILAWIPKSQKPPSAAAKATAEPSPKIMKHTGIVSRTVRARRRRGPRAVKKKVKVKDVIGLGSRQRKRPDGEASIERPAATYNADGHGDSDNDDEDEENDVFAWSEEDERALIDYFLDNCRSRWKISVPLGLRRDDESVAFRIPWLSRSGFGLVSIARKLSKRKIDVKKRLKEKLTEPDAKLQLEAAKREMIAQLNPRGTFDEELAILHSPRLTALFRRAVMMIVSPQEEYHPLVAEELISFWTAEEIRLVWRYLWLKNWIVRATERERIRGYSMSQKLQDFLKVTTLTYPMSLFYQAAEQEAMVSSTLDEADDSVGDAGSFEAEFPSNATPGQCALELGCQVLGLCQLTPVHNPIVEDIDPNPSNDDRDRARAMLARKRTLRFLNYKNQKESTGFTAHLSKRIPFKNPAILTESWQVETKMTGVVLEQSPDAYHSFEAFSSAEDTAMERPTKRARVARRKVLEVVEQVVQEAGQAGLSLDQLAAAVANHHADVTRISVASCAAKLVDSGVLVCVNAYDTQRYTTKEHGDLWLLRQYSLQHEDSGKVPRVVFEGDKDVLSFPWLKMDGATNHRFLFSIQRKLLSCVLLCPGITEAILHRRMEMLLSLQDTREAMALLVDDGLVYARASAVCDPSSVSLFGKKRRRPGPSITVATVPSHELLHVDRAIHTVHYFPHLQCLQRFGSLIQDYQHEVGRATQ